MKLTFEKSGHEPVVLEMNDDDIQTLIDKYKYMTNLYTTEECGELQAAVSKIARKHNTKNRSNLIEESVDVMMCMMIMLQQYSVLPEEIEEWIEKKTERFVDRMKSDSVIFRTKVDRDMYRDNASKIATTPLDDQLDLDGEGLDALGEVLSDNGIVIHRSGVHDGQYDISGDTDALPEYFHVLFATLMERDVNLARELVSGMSAEFASPVQAAIPAYKKRAWKQNATGKRRIGESKEDLLQTYYQTVAAKLGKSSKAKKKKSHKH